MDKFMDSVLDLINGEVKSAVSRATCDIVYKINKADTKIINGKAYILYDDAISAVRSVKEGGRWSD